MRPMPVLAAIWNTQKCRLGFACLEADCPRWHAVVERRCRIQASGDCPNIQFCPLGLHVSIQQIKRVVEIDLDDVADCMQKREALKKVCRDDCAKCSRMVIWGFASVRARLVDMFLKFLPLLHELVLPDLEEDPQVLALLSSMAEQSARSNPRLRDVIFRDGTCVSLWLLPGSAQPV